MKPVHPAEAIGFARKQKVVLPAEYYGQLYGRARAAAFSISGLSVLDQIETIRGSLNDALASGDSFRKWKAMVKSGEIELDLPAHRIETIFRTNIQGWYAAGRCRSQQANKHVLPYLMYSAVNDSRTRPAHAAMHGHIAKIDDAWWKTHMPPNGFNCRCTAIQISESEAMRRGFKPDTGAMPDIGWDYSVCSDGPGEGLGRAKNSKSNNPVKAALDKAGRLDMQTPEYLFGEEATLDEVKRLGRTQLDQLLDETLPHDRAKVTVISARGKKVGEVLSADYAISVAPAIREQLIEKLQKHRSFGAVKPNLHQKSGKGRAAILRAASRYPDDWVDNANQVAGPLHVKYSARGRGYFSKAEWIRSAREFRRVIQTSSGSTAEHEFAHHLQFADPQLDRLFVDEHRRRTAGESLVQVTPGHPREIGREDKYVIPYQGREYDGNPHEVMTVAFQSVLGDDARANEWLIKMMQNDRDMLELVLGVLFHYSPAK